VLELPWSLNKGNREVKHHGKRFFRSVKRRNPAVSPIPSLQRRKRILRYCHDVMSTTFIEYRAITDAEQPHGALAIPSRMVQSIHYSRHLSLGSHRTQRSNGFLKLLSLTGHANIDRLLLIY